MRVRSALALATIAAGGVAVTAGPASSASSPACSTATIGELASARDPESVPFAIENGGAIIRTCRDLNGDGRKDALFTVESGGTGGAFVGGIVSDDGSGPQLRAWVAGNSKTSFGFRKGRPALAWPVYRKGEPNCCATGGWRVRRYVPKGAGFKALKTEHLRSQRYPLKAKP